MKTFATRQLSFEPLPREGDGPARFSAREPGYNLSVAPTEAELTLWRADASSAKASGGDAKVSQSSASRLRMKLVGANAKAIAGVDQLPGKINHFIGNDPKQWRTKIPTYAKVSCEQVYPGVDVVYYGNGRQLEFDFVVAPGADPKQIALAFEGADKVELAANGDLVLRSGGQEVRQHKPLIYQTADGVRKEIVGGFKLNSKQEARFEVAAYDRTKPLVIDPTLVYSTYLGGSSGDLAWDVAVDSAGNVYVVGGTYSRDFPTANALQGPPPSSTFAGDSFAFVTKFAPDGTLVYSTYLGGIAGGGSGASGIAVDAAGHAYLVGTSANDDFPTTPGAYQTHRAGGHDAFVAKLSSDGSALIYSTLLGGSHTDPTDSACCAGNENGLGIAIDNSGSAYVCGITTSGDFPITPDALQTHYGGGGYRANNGGGATGDAFVAKLNPSGSQLIYSTYLGGNRDESANGIAVDASGNAYVAGTTGSTNFPTTANAFQSRSLNPPPSVGLPYNDILDAYVAKLNADGSALIYSTFLGGGELDVTGHDASYYQGGRSLAIDAAGHAYVVGTTTSGDFPLKNALQSGALNRNAFVTELTPDGSGEVFSTFLGCQANTMGQAIAVDAAGNMYVTGATGDDFLVLNALQTQPDPRGVYHGFVSKISSDGSRVLYSTYWGGHPAGGCVTEGGNSIAVDNSGNAYLVGMANSFDFPTTANAFQPQLAADPNNTFCALGNAFVSIIHSETEPPAPSPTISCPANIVVNASSGESSAVVNYSVSASSPNTPCLEVICHPPSGSAFPSE